MKVLFWDMRVNDYFLVKGVKKIEGIITEADGHLWQAWLIHRKGGAKQVFLKKEFLLIEMKFCQKKRKKC